MQLSWSLILSRGQAIIRRSLIRHCLLTQHRTDFNHFLISADLHQRTHISTSLSFFVFIFYKRKRQHAHIICSTHNTSAYFLTWRSGGVYNTAPQSERWGWTGVRQTGHAAHGPVARGEEFFVWSMGSPSCKDQEGAPCSHFVFIALLGTLFFYCLLEKECGVSLIPVFILFLFESGFAGLFNNLSRILVLSHHHTERVWKKIYTLSCHHFTNFILVIHVSIKPCSE